MKELGKDCILENFNDVKTTLKCLMAKNISSVLVFLECLEEYSKNKFRFLHIFAT